ncbi:MAG TPA: 6-phosphogluconolactonase [Candidimonas sp.]|nr:6-phosphogluconolactonase [Candidimonas sp.]
MWHCYSDPDECVTALVSHIVAQLDTAIAAEGQAGLAVSGGKSPVALFQRLSQAQLPWEHVHVTLVDERFVPTTHPDSNENLVRRHLLVKRAGAARFTGLVSHVHDIDRAVMLANRQAHAITIAVLGMGDDGHTASLFPHAPQLPAALDTSATCRFMHISPPAATHERISMTLAAILQAKQIVLPIAGDHKRDVCLRAAQQATPDLPVSYVLAQTGVPVHVYWNP